MVMAPTCSGSPATSQLTRVMLLDCSPNCVTQPPTICSTSPASMPAFSTNAFCVAPSNSVACRPDSHPFLLPMGLRVAATMTGLPIAAGENTFHYAEERGCHHAFYLRRGHVLLALEHVAVEEG